jgi:hypothetical protein
MQIAAIVFKLNSSNLCSLAMNFIESSYFCLTDNSCICRSCVGYTNFNIAIPRDDAFDRGYNHIWMIVSEDKFELKVDWYLACQEGGLKKKQQR